MAAHRMYHPEHGYHHAADGAELKRMKADGWAVQTEKEFQAVLAAKQAEKAAADEFEEVDEEVAPAPKKRGRKPKAA